MRIRRGTDQLESGTASVLRLAVFSGMRNCFPEKLEINTKQIMNEDSVPFDCCQNGGSEWVSNPPKTLLMPPDGFEVREAHRDIFAPTFCSTAGISQYSLVCVTAQLPTESQCRRTASTGWPCPSSMVYRPASYPLTRNSRCRWSRRGFRRLAVRAS